MYTDSIHIHELPSRYWEPEDDRTEDELIAAYLEGKHELGDELPDELPFE